MQCCHVLIALSFCNSVYEEEILHRPTLSRLTDDGMLGGLTEEGDGQQVPWILLHKPHSWLKRFRVCHHHQVLCLPLYTLLLAMGNPTVRLEMTLFITSRKLETTLFITSRKGNSYSAPPSQIWQHRGGKHQEVLFFSSLWKQNSPTDCYVLFPRYTTSVLTSKEAR